MTAWLVEALIASALLMLLVLALRGPVRRAFGPEAAYALWLLPALRLILPPLGGEAMLSRLVAPWLAPAAKVGAGGGAIDAARPALGASTQVVEITVAAGPVALAPPPFPLTGAPLLAVLGAVWLFGLVVFLTFHVERHRRFCARLRRGARVRAMAPVHVIESPAAAGPLAFGIWRKYVAFPLDFGERYDAEEQALALAHELTHHARGDLIANWVGLVVLGCHWFNPIAWRAFRAFRADQEMACDAQVLAGRDPALRHAYGRAIVKSAHGGAVSAACHLHTIDNLKGRLRMLSKERVSRGVMRSGLAAVAVIAVLGLGVTASGARADGTAAVPAPPAPPVVAIAAPQTPEAPPAPPESIAPTAPGAPPLPPAPPAPAKTKRVIVRGLNGKTQILEPRAGESLAQTLQRAGVDPAIGDNLPAVVEGGCAGSDPLVKQERRDGRRIVVICHRNIERVAREAEASARVAERAAVEGADAERAAKRAALAAVRAARASLDQAPGMDAAARAKALKEIDSAIAELESDGARH